MSKYETVCKLIDSDNGKTERKQLVKIIAKETKFNLSTVNAYYSKYINSKAPKKVVAKETVNKETANKDFSPSVTSSKSGGFEITINKQLTFFTLITVKHIESDKKAMSSTNGDIESINLKIEELKNRITPANEK